MRPIGQLRERGVRGRPRSDGQGARSAGARHEDIGSEAGRASPGKLGRALREKITGIPKSREADRYGYFSSYGMNDVGSSIEAGASAHHTSGASSRLSHTRELTIVAGASIAPLAPDQVQRGDCDEEVASFHARTVVPDPFRLAMLHARMRVWRRKCHERSLWRCVRLATAAEIDGDFVFEDRDEGRAGKRRGRPPSRGARPCSPASPIPMVTRS